MKTQPPRCRSSRTVARALVNHNVSSFQIGRTCDHVHEFVTQPFTCSKGREAVRGALCDAHEAAADEARQRKKKLLVLERYDSASISIGTIRTATKAGKATKEQLLVLERYKATPRRQHPHSHRSTQGNDGSAAHEPRRHRRALSLSCDLRASTRSSFLIPCAASLPSSPISPLSSSHSECENDAIRRRSRKATFSHDPLPHPIRLPNFQLYSELLKLCLLARLHPLHPPHPATPHA